MTAKKPVRTVRLRRLAAELRAKRLEAGLSPAQAAERADVSQAWIYRAENGDVRPQPNNVKAVLAACGVTDDDEIRRIVLLAKEAARHSWWETYGLSRDLAGFVALEAEASEKLVWEPALVPGLLQAAGYAREVITAGPEDLTPDRVEQLVRVRLERQKILWRETPLRLTAIIDEAVLRREVGSAEVMREQLAHLREMAAHPQVELRVVPDTAGAHPGMAGTFTILRYADPADSDIVYFESPAGAAYWEGFREVERSRRAFSHLASLSLPPGATLDLVGRYSADL